MASLAHVVKDIHIPWTHGMVTQIQQSRAYFGYHRMEINKREAYIIIIIVCDGVAGGASLAHVKYSTTTNMTTRAPGTSLLTAALWCDTLVLLACPTPPLPSRWVPWRQLSAYHGNGWARAWSGWLGREVLSMWALWLVGAPSTIHSHCCSRHGIIFLFFLLPRSLVLRDFRVIEW